MGTKPQYNRKAIAVKEIDAKMSRPGWSGRNQRIIWRHCLVVLECGHVMEKTGCRFSINNGGVFHCEYCRYGEDQELSEETKKQMLGHETLMNGWVTFEEMKRRMASEREAMGDEYLKGVVVCATSK